MSDDPFKSALIDLVRRGQTRGESQRPPLALTAPQLSALTITLGYAMKTAGEVVGTLNQTQDLNRLALSPGALRVVVAALAAFADQVGTDQATTDMIVALIQSLMPGGGQGDGAVVTSNTNPGH